MAVVSLEINKNTYILKFGMGCLINLGKKWNVPTLNETMAKFAVLEKMNGQDLGFEQIEVIIDLIEAAIISNRENKVLAEDLDSIPDVIFTNAEKLQEIVQEFVESLPKGNGKKPIPVKKK